MKTVLQDFVSLVYPRTCFNCHDSLTRAEEFLCLKCDLDLPRYSSLTKKNDLLNKFSYLPKVLTAHAFITYRKSGMAQRLIHGVKYKGRKELGIWLGSRFGEELKKSQIEVDMIIPLPIHDRRRAQRGYNQSEVICEGISTSLNSPIFSDLVKRTHHRDSQTKKSRIERWKNLEASFEVQVPSRIKGKNILLFDDVITTGATMASLCEEVSRFEPKSIHIGALAAGK